MLTDYKPELIELVRQHALEVKPPGEFFTLKSGKQSSYYLDLRNLHLTPAGLHKVVCALWQEMSKIKHDCYGGPSIGADPIIGGLAFMSGMMPSRSKYCGFMIRPESKDHGKSGRLVGPVKKGDRCVLVEDVVTTGGSSMDAIGVLEEAGLMVVHAFCVVDRLNGGAEKFAEKGIPFTPLLTIRDFGLDPV